MRNLLLGILVSWGASAEAMTIDATPLQNVRSATQIFQATFSPGDSGRILVAAGHNVAQITYAPIAAIWSIDDPSPYAYMGASYSPDGNFAAAGGYNTLRIYDALDGHLRKEIAAPNGGADFLDALEFSSDHHLMFSGGFESDRVVVFSTDTWMKIQEFLCPATCSITAVRLSADGTVLRASSPTHLYSWDFLTGELRSDIETHYTGEVKLFKFTATGEHVFVSDGVRGVSHFDVETGQRIRGFDHADPIELVSFALDPTMSFLATLGTVGRPQDGSDFIITLWDVVTGQVAQTLRFANDGDFAALPRTIDFSADGSRLLWSTTRNIQVHQVR